MNTYAAVIETDAVEALQRWREWTLAGGTTSLFQTTGWLAAWYATLGAQPGQTPLLAAIVRPSDNKVLLVLPLVLSQQGRLARIGFADLGVADYAAPMIMPDCPDDAVNVRAMFAALCRALPAADLLAFEKMPATVDRLANPLLHLRGVQPSSLFGNPLQIGEDFDAWRFSREKTHRKELERSWRVFTRHPGAAFRQITDLTEAQRVLEALEVHQRSTISGKGWSYILDVPAYRDFYRTLLADGLSTGDVVLTALMVDDQVIAALLGLRRAQGYAMIRIGNAGGEWRNCSPGRLVIERTMAALHAQGVRHFDFTIGDYAYKKGFMPEQLPLFDLTVALSHKGIPHAVRTGLKSRIRTWLASHPGLHRRVSATRAKLARKTSVDMAAKQP